MRRDAQGRTTCAGEGPFPGAVRELAWTYAVPNRRDRYRWKRIQCPLCRRLYAGWYVMQPAFLELPRYELYDTSYWHSGNDEPAPEDEAGAIQWTREALETAVREYVTRHGLPKHS